MSKPLVRCLSFSGGRQSTALLWMAIRGDIPVDPDNFLVLTADPGMEDSRTYPHIAEMQDRARRAGFTALTVDGPNLYNDILALSGNGKTRIDNPPYWTDRGNGHKEGRLMQKCTAYYKIAPMDRALRAYLHERHGISRETRRLDGGCVEKWIGFGLGEVGRIKPSSQKYITFAYPLIEQRTDITRYFAEIGKPMPPRSVCLACFSNGLDYYQDMFENRPDDWARTVAVDEAARDWSQIGVRNPVYVSKTLTPLTELAANGFRFAGRENDDDYCNSGVCFL